uniref:Late embryogenesis abundant protein LEA-2 subgroup domain-containing protein n=1 Tax=Fagus sylvatica TaxID=28930 RepID=A0A2N9HED8_FAGSY
MADRVYPSSKPVTNGTAAAPTTAANGAFPATKAQLYGATRPAYRPQAHNRRRHSRSCCCSCCIWITFLLFFIILLVAIAGAIFYVLYRPHRPSFFVTNFKVSYLNLTSSSTLNSKFDLNITAKNPNKKLVYIYNPITVSILSNDIDIGDGTIPSFVQDKKNTTLLKAAITNTGKALDSTSVSTLKTDIKSKNGLPLKIELNTKVKAKVGGLKTPNIGIRVTCDGISATVPTGKTAATASTSNAKCKVDIRIKIWKWTF